MMLDIKQLQIIDIIIQNPIMTKNSLIKRLKLTERQIDYAIGKINQRLTEYAKPPVEIEGAYINVPIAAYNYLLKLRVNENLTALSHYSPNTAERQLFLGLLLSCHDSYLSLVHLQDYLQVSQSTISKDLKNLEQHLLPFQLRIHYDRQSGYRIEGQENHIRSFLIWTISGEILKNNFDLLNTCVELIQHIDVKEALNTVAKAAKHFHIDFVENRLLEFSYIWIFMVSRLKIRPYYLPPLAKKISIVQTSEYKFAKTLLQSSGFEQSTACEYLTTIVLCLSIGGLKQLKIDQDIYEINKQIVQRFSDISGIVFNNSEKVYQQMFTHFRSMFYRLRFGYPIVNPLTQQVKKKYGEIFTLVAQATRNYESQLGKIPDDELAFLTIHLISFIYKNDSTKNDSVVAAIVCPNGIGSSALAYLQLTNLFSNIKFLKPFRYADLGKHLAEVDLIFSTFYRSELFDEGKPCFVINPIMTIEEKYNLVQSVNSRLSSTTFSIPTLESVMSVVAHTIKDGAKVDHIRHDLSNSLFRMQVIPQKNNVLHLSDVLKSNYIQLNVQAETPKAAILKAATPLLDDDVITPNYVDSIINRTDDRTFASYVIAPKVALPHTRPSCGAKKVAVGITTLDTPINFGATDKYNVQFIFFLSVINTTDHLNVLQDLINLLSKSDFLELLCKKSITTQQVMSYILAQQDHKK